MKKKINAEIIADSINEQGDRITTYILTMPRIVLAEFNTHRMLSRNSASSRAIPFKKMVDMVTTDPFVPIKFQKDHSGMQGTEYFEGAAHDVAERKWQLAAGEAVKSAKSLNDMGVTKQLCNRILEPFMWHTVIATGTEWENFFKLRDHSAAEIHIHELASRMKIAREMSEPKLLKPGEWHIPFGNNISSDVTRYSSDKSIQADLLGKDLTEYHIKIATARCARVSYMNYEGKDDYEADLKLYDRLSKMGHWSPFEHCARSMTDRELNTNAHLLPKKHIMSPSGVKIDSYSIDKGWSGNFKGFVQLRKTFEDESGR